MALPDSRKNIIDLHVHSLQNRISDDDDSASVRFEGEAENLAESVHVVEIGNRVIRPAGASIRAAFDVNFAKAFDCFFKVWQWKSERHRLSIANRLPVFAEIACFQLPQFLSLLHKTQPEKLWTCIPHVVIVIKI